MPNHLVHLPASEADFMAMDAVPILAPLPKEELDTWIPRLLRTKRPFAVDSVETMPPEYLIRLSETAERRKTAIAVLHSYRLLPVFARLKELVVSNCLGKLHEMQMSIPSAANPILSADLAAWLCHQQLEPSFNNDDNECIAVHLSTENGYATACFNVSSHFSELTFELCGTIHAITVPYADPFHAEMDILANTIPFKRKWPLLMHVDDAANAIARFQQETLKNSQNNLKCRHEELH